jgi:hypothetical protein
MIRRDLAIFVAMLAFAAAVTQTPPNSPVPSPAVPSDDKIRKILVERINSRHQGVGIVVGIVDSHVPGIATAISPA